MSNEFDNFIKENGVIRQVTPRYTPQMNGVAERKNRHILETTRVMLFEFVRKVLGRYLSLCSDFDK